MFLLIGNVYISGIGKSNVVETVTQIQPNGKIPVIIHNPDASTKRIRHGDLVAKVSEAKIIKTIRKLQ